MAMNQAERAAAARAAYAAQKQARINQFLDMNGMYLTVRVAARRMGVCEKTIIKWRAEVRAARRTPR